MPIVPTTRVQGGGLGRLNRTRVDANDFGAQEAQALSNVGTAVTNVGAKEIDRLTELEQERNSADAKNLGLEYEAERNAITTELYNRRGGDAIAHEEEARQKLTRARERVLAKANRAEVRDVLDIDTKEAEQIEMVRFNNFMSGERDRYFLDTSQARLDGAIDNIVANPDPENIGRQSLALNAEVINIAKKKGWSVEQTAQFAKTAYTNAHVGAIELLMEEQGVGAAMDHFEEYKPSITPDQQARLQAKFRSAIEQRANVSLADAQDAFKAFTATGLFTLEYDVLIDQAEATGTERGKRLASQMRVARNNADKIQTFQTFTLEEQTSTLEAIANDVQGIEDAYFHSMAAANYQETLKAAQNGTLLELEDRRGLIELAPLTSPKEREAQAQALSRKLGVPVPVVTPSDVKAIVKNADKKDLEKLVQDYQTFYQDFSRDAANSVVDALADERPAHAVAMLHSSTTPDMSLAIVRGSRLIKDNPDLKMDKGMVSDVRVMVGNLFLDAPEAVPAYTEALKGLYADRLSQGFEVNIEGLVDELLPSVVHNDQTTLVPPGWTKDRFYNFHDTVTADELAAVGNGAPVLADGTPFNPDFLRPLEFFRNDVDEAGQATLVQVYPGAYQIQFAHGGVVMTQDGLPYIAELGVDNATIR